MGEITVDHPSVRSRQPEAGAAPCWAVVRQCIVGFALALVCQTALAQAMYRITPLGYLGGCNSSAPVGYASNNAEQVTGSACNANGDSHAFLWKNDGTPMADLGPSAVGSTSYGWAISASGLVVGGATDSTGTFVFKSSGDGTPMSRLYNEWTIKGDWIASGGVNALGQVTGSAYAATSTYLVHAFLWKNNGSSMLDLGTLGGDDSYGYAINGSGQVSGAANTTGNAALHAVVWKIDGTPVDLGSLGAYSTPDGPLDESEGLFINASGQVAGWSIIPGNKAVKKHAFFWQNDGTPMKNLGTLGGFDSYPVALNNSGQIAGSSETHGRNNSHAFVWLNDGTPMKDLGTLGGTASGANDMNSSGQVTGHANLAGDVATHAFLWRNDGTKIQDLNALIDPTDPLQPYVTLASGNFIDKFSDIVADGTDSRTGLQGLYLLQGTVLTLTPRALAFGNTKIHTSSAAKSVTMTNTSAKVVAIASIALTGTAAGQFAATNNCGKSLAGHATCTIKVTFKPTTKGAKSATLNVNGGGGGLLAVSLTGTAT
jgi:probable HAF family extracellular repeat protein